MEVVVSAAVLLLVVLGVMAGLDAVAGTAGANKARTVAASLAEKDQEELRSLMTVDLNRIRSVIPGPRTVEVDGVPYTVESDAQLVSDVGGEDISCALDDGEGSYIRITSKMTSPMTGARVKPVVLSSIVAPEPGSGALVAMVVNAEGDPVKNLPVQAVGPETKTKTTNDAGCAVFGAVTAGAYEVKVNQVGWVDPEGLIANRFVRVKHDVTDACGANNTNSSSPSRVMTDYRIEAAILALKDSFVVDNYQCGAALGELTVFGAIAQKFRGPVGTFSGTTLNSGYEKDYNYNDALRYRSPPYFLDPMQAAWRVIRANEQVPAAQ